MEYRRWDATLYLTTIITHDPVFPALLECPGEGEGGACPGGCEPGVDGYLCVGTSDMVGKRLRWPLECIPPPFRVFLDAGVEHSAGPPACLCANTGGPGAMARAT